MTTTDLDGLPLLPALTYKRPTLYLMPTGLQLVFPTMDDRGHWATSLVACGMKLIPSTPAAPSMYGIEGIAGGLIALDAQEPIAVLYHDARRLICCTHFADAYEAAAAIGAEIDHHESDLYLKDSTPVRLLVKAWQFGKTARRFIDSEGATWWDLPFAWSPYWEGKLARLAPKVAA